jgi:hypothetical protein
MATFAANYNTTQHNLQIQTPSYQHLIYTLHLRNDFIQSEMLPAPTSSYLQLQKVEAGNTLHGCTHSLKNRFN